ncbi:hypothetical protein CXG81DRAFT_30000 [Caulochytrium protostelioides]|uniref:DUF4200 domain-containing protein n=1 Tax=Caulochytrium protostelioides TaxID=1555241 RepID=A0A4P9WXI7_9FUNG|nr:hypothetical protein CAUPRSCDRAFT_9671 [Caulochytrium protostelioides]RKP00313.1 hypothetical protein CXG81DRAFT_30000 [Caulochytrium protostelioides]|eukprot:RKP00313.1 hypothetical protein CXG81DRAFT_30000 [Caulochytrium protostelioides]
MNVEHGLEQQKEEFATKMKYLKWRQEELSRKDQQLKDNLQKFSKYLKENDVKRLRALRKAYDEEKTCHEKDVEIVTLNHQLAAMTASHAKQNAAVDRLVFHQRYLEHFIECNDDYGELQDIVARHTNLASTNVELSAKRTRVLQSIDDQTAALAAALQKHSDMTLESNNTIAMLQAKLEAAQNQTAKAQAHYQRAASGVSHRTLLLSQVKMATSNLVTTIRSHFEGRMANVTTTMEQLDAIHVVISDLDAICRAKALNPD